MAFFLYSGNRLEDLADRLIEKCGERRGDLHASLFRSEIVIVQSRGMEKWLRLRIAEKEGVAANISFPFPKSFIYDSLFSRAFGISKMPACFQPESMAWKIMKVLPELIAQDKSSIFSLPKSYLDQGAGVGDASAKLKLYQLSRKIADVFDQYMIYRPEMPLNGWALPDGERRLDPSKIEWQKILFEKISEEAEELIPPKLFLDFISTLDENGSCSEKLSFPELPGRIFVFGISVMPPIFVKLFKALSNRIDIHFFHMSPCGEYCPDLETEKNALTRSRKKDKSIEEMHYDISNPVLASMGKYGMDFRDLITGILGDFEERYFEPPEGTDLLSLLQRNIVSLETPEKVAPSTSLNIQFHSCYNPMRELELLYDCLLDLIEKDGINPKDIAVVTPDISLYAPYIKAVFDLPEDPANPGEVKKYIPHSIADRKMSAESPVFKAFTGILDAERNRYSAAAIMDVLDTDGVREKFGLNASEISSLRSWIADARVVWGVDAEDRLSRDLPPFEEGSWRNGLRRLLLGFALGTEENAQSYAYTDVTNQKELRIFPYDKIEEGNAIALGKLANFAEMIFDFGKSLGEERGAAEWSDLFQSLLDDFFVPAAGNKNELECLKEQIRKLALVETSFGYDEKVPIEVVRACLMEKFEQESAVGGFMRCGVTFCEILPMRGIPFEAVCMIGMNDTAFPRQSLRIGFDIIQDSPQKCDRNLRLEDKYLFLESLMSARKRLHVSYIGLSMDDNKALPPSVLVSDLKDYLVQKFGCAEDDIFTEHSLQAFSYRNYVSSSDMKRFSYSKDNFDAAKELLSAGGKKTAHVFWPFGLRTKFPEEITRIDIDPLIRFFKNPAEYFLKNCLKLRLDENRDGKFKDNEIFSVAGADRRALTRDLIAVQSGDVEPDPGFGKQFFSDSKAKGILPVEPFASVAFKGILTESEKLSKRLKTLSLNCRRIGKFHISIQISEKIVLSGSFGDLYENKSNNAKRQLLSFSGKEAMRHLFEGWIRHLALNADGRAAVSYLIFDDPETPRFLSAMDSEAALAELRKLVEIYKEGLTYPLPFFPQSSAEFVKYISACSGIEVEKLSLEKAAKLFEPDDYNEWSESQNSYIKYCFSESFFKAEEFREHRNDFMERAKTLLLPLENAFKKSKESSSDEAPASDKKKSKGRKEQK